MGKTEDEQTLPSTELDAQGTNPSEGYCNWCCLSCRRVKKLVTFRCILVLVLCVAVLLSAVFWLPFFHYGDQKDLDLNYEGHDIVASFMLKKAASFLEDYITLLEDDIFDEMSFLTTKVEIISLESSAGSDLTKVVFAVESDVTTQSLIKDSFVYLIIRQSFLNLTNASLFGEPFSFEVLKFRGGITASPEQKAFLMQRVQILFNFTLNFSMDQLLSEFDQLSSQLKSGLQLAPYENLYIKLTNLKGSSVAPPTTVQSQVLLAVGVNPSNSRLKQLAQTITSSHKKNLGLNNTVFGRVKQVQLSSTLQHSLGGDGSVSSPSPSPSLPPMSQSHHRHHHVASLAPIISPSQPPGNRASVNRKKSPTSAPAPAPGKNLASNPPSCHFGYNNRSPWKRDEHYHLTPSSPPIHAPNPALSLPKQNDPLTPKSSQVSSPSPSPNVAYVHSLPPSKNDLHARPPDVMPLVSPLPEPSESKKEAVFLGKAILSEINHGTAPWNIVS
ncbi:uncharacterized protein [Primulina eburnea]|uniref:uncharacterized protein isoform X1 n=1 Tax=Primulina eburnea TaxID=1245227 RepID=UPI003C6BDA65